MGKKRVFLVLKVVSFPVVESQVIRFLGKAKGQFFSCLMEKRTDARDLIFISPNCKVAIIGLLDYSEKVARVFVHRIKLIV